MGANIPGKAPIGLAYFGPIAHYRNQCESVMANGFKDFKVGAARA